MITPRFKVGDVERASLDWRCSCGPAALAVICGLTLDEAKPLFDPAFPGWTTPTRMLQALRNAGQVWRQLSIVDGQLPWPQWGLCRIQWHGPWTRGGANPRWAYVHTHWIGVSRLRLLDGSEDPHAVCVWDINAMNLGDGWSPVAWWSSQVVPALTSEIPRASGGWHVTHAIEVER